MGIRALSHTHRHTRFKYLFFSLLYVWPTVQLQKSHSLDQNCSDQRPLLTVHICPSSHRLFWTQHNWTRKQLRTFYGSLSGLPPKPNTTNRPSRLPLSSLNSSNLDGLTSPQPILTDFETGALSLRLKPDYK